MKTIIVCSKKNIKPFFTKGRIYIFKKGPKDEDHYTCKDDEGANHGTDMKWLKENFNIIRSKLARALYL